MCFEDIEVKRHGRLVAGQGTSRVEAGSNTPAEAADRLQAVGVAVQSTGLGVADRPSFVASTERGTPWEVVDKRPQVAEEQCIPEVAVDSRLVAVVAGLRNKLVVMAQGRTEVVEGKRLFREA